MSDQTRQKVSDEAGHGVNIRRYARVPQSVLCDPKLSAYAKCVYGVMALNVFQGNVAKIGQRLIANKLGINKDTVCKAVAELVERKHIGVIGKGRQRRWYSLLSAVYAQKQRAGVEEVVSAPSGGHRLATVAKKRA